VFLTIWLIVGIIVWLFAILNELFCRNTYDATVWLLVMTVPVLILLWPITLLIALAEAGIIKDIDIL